MSRIVPCRSARNTNAPIRARRYGRPSRALELAETDCLHQLLELGPVDLLRDLDGPVIRRDFDSCPLRTGKTAPLPLRGRRDVGGMGLFEPHDARGNARPSL